MKWLVYNILDTEHLIFRVKNLKLKLRTQEKLREKTDKEAEKTTEPVEPLPVRCAPY